MKRYQKIWMLITALICTTVGFAAAESQNKEKDSFLDKAPQENPGLFQNTTESYESAITKTVLFLALLLVLVFLSFWVLRRFSSGRLRGFSQEKSIKILEKRSLSPKSILYLLDIHGKRILIAESQCEVRAITNIEGEKIKDL